MFPNTIYSTLHTYTHKWSSHDKKTKLSKQKPIVSTLPCMNCSIKPGKHDLKQLIPPFLPTFDCAGVANRHQWEKNHSATNSCWWWHGPLWQNYWHRSFLSLSINKRFLKINFFCLSFFLFFLNLFTRQNVAVRALFKKGKQTSVKGGDNKTKPLHAKENLCTNRNTDAVRWRPHV